VTLFYRKVREEIARQMEQEAQELFTGEIEWTRATLVACAKVSDQYLGIFHLSTRLAVISSISFLKLFLLLYGYATSGVSKYYLWISSDLLRTY
jgi:hypothetical protein